MSLNLIYRVNLFVVSAMKVTLIKTYFEVDNWCKMIMYHFASVSGRAQGNVFFHTSECDVSGIQVNQG